MHISGSSMKETKPCLYQTSFKEHRLAIISGIFGNCGAKYYLEICMELAEIITKSPTTKSKAKWARISVVISFTKQEKIKP
ncbi:hypothetical protein GV64_19860 [Endozoicomonas elysicola]|uniref:Uncharacterized protein n=1 Tax=Endozoicomonas elysicola TaxID=305900 RepID=A0A081KEV3_9GAMM|nr:hypothetical protein GV64_19860 [Endozoicomonas elysicola]